MGGGLCAICRNALNRWLIISGGSLQASAARSFESFGCKNSNMGQGRPLRSRGIAPHTLPKYEPLCASLQRRFGFPRTHVPESSKRTSPGLASQRVSPRTPWEVLRRPVWGSSWFPTHLFPGTLPGNMLVLAFCPASPKVSPQNLPTRLPLWLPGFGPHFLARQTAATCAFCWLLRQGGPQFPLWFSGFPGRVSRGKRLRLCLPGNSSPKASEKALLAPGTISRNLPRKHQTNARLQGRSSATESQLQSSQQRRQCRRMILAELRSTMEDSSQPHANMFKICAGPTPEKKRHLVAGKRHHPQAFLQKS